MKRLITRALRLSGFCTICQKKHCTCGWGSR